MESASLKSGFWRIRFLKFFGSLARQMSRAAGIAPAGSAPVNEAAAQMEVIAALAKELDSAEGRTRLEKFRTVIARAAREDRQDR